MAVANFKNIVPFGKDALFPFQMSAASLSTSATVYQLAGTDGAKTTVGSGVSVIDDGGGLYRLKVTSGSMSGSNLYYATVVAGSEQVRIPMWSYAPTGHTDDILSRIGGSAAAMSFTGILSGANNLQGAVDLLGGELGDFSTSGITGNPASAAAAMKIIFDNVDTLENSIGLENDADTAATLFGRIKKNKAVADAIKTDTDDLLAAVGDHNDAASADYGTDKSLMGMVRLLGADVGENQTDLNSIISKVDTVDGIVDSILADTAVIGAPAGVSVSADIAALKAETALIVADTAELQGDWANGGRLDLILDASAADALAAKTASQANKATLENGTHGLAQLQSEIADNQTDLNSILAAGVSRDSAIATVDSEIGTLQTDLTAGFLAGAKSSEIVALDNVVDAGFVAGAKASDLATAKTEIDGIRTDTEDIQVKIAAVQATADTLALQVNAVLQPMVPSERYSGAAAKRISLVIQTIDGATGAADNMDQAGTPAGQMYIKVLDGAGNSVTDLHDAASGGNALASADASIYSGAVSGYKIMNNVSTGFYQAFLEIAAYKVESYDVLFYAQDSDPNTAQEFRAMRQMEVRSPVQAQFAGGAF